MRKYQQLVLVVISLLSISVLLMYKSENNRLKYVLQVVNFFGRNDAAVLSRIENGTKQEIYHDLSSPLPVWQRISDEFYIYTAFWEEFGDTPRGDAVALVVGRKDAIINFKCSLRFKNGSEIRASFLFMPINLPGDEKSNHESFATFKFMCQVKRNSPEVSEPPTSIILAEVKSGGEQEIQLRRVKNFQTKTAETTIIACLNLVSYKAQGINNKDFLTKELLMQFFMHHKIIGIEEFMVYNADLIPTEIKKMLAKAGIHVHYLPFNFPFRHKNLKVRGVVEMDCSMRATGASKYTILLEPNEFLYPNTNIHFKDSIISSLVHYPEHISRYELATFSVCMDHKNQLLMDNNFYDPENEMGHKLYISKCTLHPQAVQSVTLPASRSFAHNYINCISSKDLLYDWRNSIREDFMQYIQTVRNELSFLF